MNHEDPQKLRDPNSETLPRPEGVLCKRPRRTVDWREEKGCGLQETDAEKGMVWRMRHPVPYDRCMELSQKLLETEQEI